MTHACCGQVWREMHSAGVRGNPAILSHLYLALARCKLTDQQKDVAWQIFLDFRKATRVDSRLATACLTFCRSQADSAGIMHIWKYIQEVRPALCFICLSAICQS